MSSLTPASNRSFRISQAPRATLTIRMNGGRDDVMRTDELAAIQRSVQQGVERIARALHDRQGKGRSPAFLKELSALDAVNIDDGSSVVSFEAPHDTEQFPIDFGEGDAGVQAIERFVQAVGSLLHGEDVQGMLGGPAERSIRAFINSVQGHDRVSIVATVGETDTTIDFHPQEIPPRKVRDATSSTLTKLSFVGRLYGANLLTKTFRFKDELGRSRLVVIDDELDSVALARALLGEIAYVKADVVTGDRSGTDHILAVAIEQVDPSQVPDYDHWIVGTSLEVIETETSMEELTIPGLTGDPEDSNARVVKD